MLVDVQIFAPAKVNIGLKVLDKESSGVYADSGFHCIESIFQTVSLCDELHIYTTDVKNSCEVELVDNFSLLSLPKENTITKTYEEFCRLSKIDTGVRVLLKKNIPAGGGLGGGSSDAASFLFAFAELNNFTVTDEIADAVASKVGSDVFFFMKSLLNRKSAALVSGRGEVVKSIEARNDLKFVILIPDVHSSTKEAYELLDDSYEAGNYIACPNFRDYERIYRNSVEKWNFVNSFTPVLVNKYPIIGEAIEDMKNNGALWADMSGSGSVVFGVFKDLVSAEQCVALLNAKNKWKQCVIAH